MSKNKFCVKCGKKISDTDEFCPNCGAKQSSSTAYATQNQGKVPENTQKVVKPKKPWYKRVWCWIGIILLFFILIIAIASCGDSDSDSDSSSSSSQSTGVKKHVKRHKHKTKQQKKSLRVLNKLSTNQLHQQGVANAQNFRYGQLIKSNDEYAKPYAISKGEVLQAQEANDETDFLIYINEDENQLFRVSMSGKSKAIEGDYISTDGVLDKIFDYDTQSGGSNTVPTIFTKKVTVIGHDPDED